MQRLCWAKVQPLNSSLLAVLAILDAPDVLDVHPSSSRPPSPRLQINCVNCAEGMLLTTALVAALLGVSPALAAPHLQKRFDNAYILSYRTNLCLTLPPGIPPSNGAELITGACSSASTWEISPGSGSVILKGTNYALDAGTDPHNNVPAKIWQSYPGLTQQT